jgi:hypothetical protein
LAMRNITDATPFHLTALFAMADPLRKEAHDVIRQLHQHSIATWMISGDNEITAKAVANSVGIPLDHVITGVLPHEKVRLSSYPWPKLDGTGLSLISLLCRPKRLSGFNDHNPEGRFWGGGKLCGRKTNTEDEPS